MEIIYASNLDKIPVSSSLKITSLLYLSFGVIVTEAVSPAGIGDLSIFANVFSGQISPASTLILYVPLNKSSLLLDLEDIIYSPVKVNSYT